MAPQAMSAAVTSMTSKWSQVPSLSSSESLRLQVAVPHSSPYFAKLGSRPHQFPAAAPVHRDAPLAGATRRWRSTAGMVAAAVAATRRVPLRSTSPGAAGQPGGQFLTSTTAPILLLVLAVLYGGNVPLLKTIETSTPLDLTAPEVLYLRFLLASLTVLPWAAANSDKALAVWRPAGELAVWLFLGYTLQILALDKTSVSTCSVAAASTGVIVQALEFAFDKKPISPTVAFFALGTIAGIALFVTAPSGEEGILKFLADRLNIFNLLAPVPKMPHEALLAGAPGEALALAGAGFFALHVWRCNRIISDGDSSGKVDESEFELAIAAAQSLLATLLCAAFSFLDSPYPLSQQLDVLNRLDSGIWLQIFACGAICTGAPAILELYAFKVVDPALSSLIYCTIPLWGTVLGVIFLKEAISLQAIVGGIIILVCSLTPSILEIMGNKDENKES